jgi:hypothetical protein
MPVNFREFKLKNGNGISVKLMLEAPAGTPVIETEVGAGDTYTVNPQVSDIRSVKITVVAGGREHTDVETLELGGAPFPMFFETVNAHTRIGSIRGSISAAF